jgi:cytochrome c-type biogenesis protein CcmH
MDAQRIVGAPRGRALVGAALEARTHEVAGLLRCPVCQGLSVGDSPSSLAQEMKGQVRELLAAGYDEEQILTYFEASYGEFVRLKPPLRGANWLVWFSPAIALLVGGAVVYRTLRARRSGAAENAPADAPGPETLPEDPKLARYVLMVREQVYGWPGGAPPGDGAR